MQHDLNSSFEIDKQDPSSTISACCYLEKGQLKTIYGLVDEGLLFEHQLAQAKVLVLPSDFQQASTTESANTSGYHSVVVKAIQLSTGRPVAIKKLKRFHGSFNMFRQEVCALLEVQAANCPNVLRMVGAYVSPCYSIVFDYAEDGTLHDLLSDPLRARQLTLQDRIELAKDIARGAYSLHAHVQRLHCDLTSKNILVGRHAELQRWFAIVADLGLSVKISEAHRYKHTGHPRWSDPALVYPTKQTDVYMYGGILYELFTGRMPFEGHTSAEIRTGTLPVYRRGSSEDLSVDVPQRIRGLLTRCWSENPDVRPDFCEILDQLELAQRELAMQYLLDVHNASAETLAAHWSGLAASPSSSDGSSLRVNFLRRSNDVIGKKRKRDIAFSALPFTKPMDLAEGRNFSDSLYSPRPLKRARCMDSTMQPTSNGDLLTTFNYWLR